MAQSVEVLLDDDLDARVRGQWARLDAAGLPNLAQHPGETNRPHLTLTVADLFEPHHEAALAALAGALPIRLRLGPLLLFDSDRGQVLVRLVVPSLALLSLHASVHSALAGTVRPGHVRPGRWTPHVTLAHRLGPGQVGAALACLGRSEELDGQGVALRRWDSGSKRAWTVG